MPRRRMVYVRDEDEPVWQRAEELAGGEESASAVVAEALRRYVAAKEVEAGGFRRVDLDVKEWVGRGGVLTKPHRRVAFQGRLLAEYAESGPLNRRDWSIYATAKGQFLVYAGGPGAVSADFRVFSSFDGVKRWSGDDRLPQLPQALVDTAAQELGDDGVVELDI